MNQLFVNGELNRDEALARLESWVEKLDQLVIPDQGDIIVTRAQVQGFVAPIRTLTLLLVNDERWRQRAATIER